MDLLNAKIKLFRLARIDVYVHSLFVLYIAFQLIRGYDDPGWTALYLAILFGSVFLHELGHCFAARAMGGDATEVLMWPLGGLASCDAARRPWPQFVVAAAGPAVNGVLAVIGLIVGWFMPYPQAYGGYYWAYTAVQILYYSNLGNMIFNIIPAYPMDGGRIFHTILWPWLGFKRSLRLSIYLAFACGGLMIAVSLGGLAPGGVPELAAIGLFVILSAYRELQLLRWGELQEDTAEPWQRNVDLDTEEERGPGPIKRFFERRAEARKVRDEQEAQARADRLDDVLRRVNEVGLGGLSPSERAFLEEESARRREKS